MSRASLVYEVQMAADALSRALAAIERAADLASGEERTALRIHAADAQRIARGLCALQRLAGGR